MNSPFPIFLNPQSHSYSSNGGGAKTLSLEPVSKDESLPPAQSFDKAFSQVLNEQQNLSVFLKQLQSLGLTQQQVEVVSSLSEFSSNVLDLKKLAIPEHVADILRKDQVSGNQGFPDEILLNAVGADGVLDLEELSSTLSSTISNANPIEPIVIVNQNLVAEKDFLSSVVPSNFQAVLKTPEPGFSSSKNSGKKLAEALATTQTLPQGTVINKDSSGSQSSEVLLGRTSTPHTPGSQSGEVLLDRTSTPQTKVPLSGLSQVPPFVLENHTQQQSSLSRFSIPLARADHSLANPIAPPTAVQPEGPVGFVRPELSNQGGGQALSGALSQLGVGANTGSEQQRSVPADLLGETGLLGKGDRVQSVVETSLKSLSMDPSGGQGLGNGMSQFSNSQSGFQQSTMFAQQGAGLRALEERAQEFPVPTLQRLQMDVQLSENQRVQIDVGVQNRQVYAGLTVDHSILRNLANQFVPQLEDQLNQVDLELEEFSAEVRDEREQQTHSMFDESQGHREKRSGRDSQGDGLAAQGTIIQQEESKFHFMA